MKRVENCLGSFLFGDNMAREFSKSFYNSKEWQRCRDYILKRDNYLCAKCGNPAEEVHHIIHLSPDNIMNPKITLSADNLTCLCKECHFAEHRDNSKEHLNEYEFDSNGYLVRKEAPL